MFRAKVGMMTEEVPLYWFCAGCGKRWEWEIVPFAPYLPVNHVDRWCDRECWREWRLKTK